MLKRNLEGAKHVKAFCQDEFREGLSGDAARRTSEQIVNRGKAPIAVISLLSPIDCGKSGDARTGIPSRIGTKQSVR